MHLVRDRHKCYRGTGWEGYEAEAGGAFPEGNDMS
jgi:hypothetical protein